MIISLSAEILTSIGYNDPLYIFTFKAFGNYQQALFGMKSINRNALILEPKKPLYEWVNYIYQGEPVECPEKPFSHDHATVYLIPEQQNQEEYEQWMKKNFQTFFRNELFDWCTDKTEWPSPLTYKLFQEWFHISYQTMIFDTV
ncbi:MAG: hypothetical protein Q8859_03795 [Bacteroidota bacterium]|nr:hypothetical protein [Bacteroidota bacterium]